MPLRLLRRVLLTSALAIAILACLPSLARADITVYQEQSLPRVDAEGRSVNKRSLSLKPEGVSYQDCVDGLKIRFPLQLSGFEGNGVLEVWAGLADCKPQTNRNGAAAVCWNLLTGVPLQLNSTVDIPVRDIMSGVNSALDASKNKGPEVCGTVDLANVLVQFLYFAPGQRATPTMNKDISVEVDTIGPAAPTGLRTEPGNGRIRVIWDNISGEGGVSVLTGVKVYCDKIGSPALDSGTSQPAEEDCEDIPNTPDASEDGGDAGEIDAGFTRVCKDGGTSGGGSGGACDSANLSAGTIPDAKFNEQFECGGITGNAGSSAVADKVGGQPLQNRNADNPDVTYAVAVAATDAFGNVGPLSTPICEYPEETTDFWKKYREAGGNAGGGCATTGSPIGSVSVLTGLTIAVLSMARRRWTARREARRNGR